MKSELISQCRQIVLAAMTIMVTSACLASTPTYVVSMIQLLDSLGRYEGKTVSVKGYLDTFTGLKLYLTKDHAIIHDFPSSILVSEEPGISDSECADSYVEIVGKIVRLNSSIFAIVDLTKISNPIDGNVCWTP